MSAIDEVMRAEALRAADSITGMADAVTIPEASIRAAVDEAAAKCLSHAELVQLATTALQARTNRAVQAIAKMLIQRKSDEIASALSREFGVDKQPIIDAMERDSMYW